MHMNLIQRDPEQTMIRDLKNGDVAVIFSGPHRNMVVQRYGDSLVLLGDAVRVYDNLFNRINVYEDLMNRGCRILKSGEIIELV